jgi:hypothetical protein
MDDELGTPIIVEPEDLFDDLREQTAVTRLAEGLLRYSDPSFAPTPPADEPEAEGAALAAD